MTQTNCPFYPFHWLVFEKHALRVFGSHHPEPMEVSDRVKPLFQNRWEKTRQKVLSSPGGFDGHRAVLLSWETCAACREFPTPGLKLETGYRTYTEGLALKQLVAELGSRVEGAAPLAELQPLPTESWGSSLTTVVLLPDNGVLAGQRSPLLQVNPGRWSCVFTEILEPSDVHPVSMEPLLGRLTSEELKPLENIAKHRHRFVGLLLVPHSYTWTVVSVLDLTRAPPADVQQAVAELQPDAETAAWQVVPLGSAHFVVPGLSGLELARDVARRLR